MDLEQKHTVDKGNKTQSQYETALSSPGVGSVTGGLAIYPVPLLRTPLGNCPINQCPREAELPLLAE